MRIGKHGGLTSNSAKLTLLQIKTFKELYKAGATMEQLAKIYEVTTTTICRHLKELDHPNKLRGMGGVEGNCIFTKLTKGQAKQIILLRLRDGVTQNEIAEKFNIHQSTISNICTGKSWKHLFQGIRKKYNKEALKLI